MHDIYWGRTALRNGPCEWERGESDAQHAAWAGAVTRLNREPWHSRQWAGGGGTGAGVASFVPFSLTCASGAALCCRRAAPRRAAPHRNPLWPLKGPSKRTRAGCSCYLYYPNIGLTKFWVLGKINIYISVNSLICSDIYTYWNFNFISLYLIYEFMNIFNINSINLVFIWFYIIIKCKT